MCLCGLTNDKTRWSAISGRMLRFHRGCLVSIFGFCFFSGLLFDNDHLFISFSCDSVVQPEDMTGNLEDFVWVRVACQVCRVFSKYIDFSGFYRIDVGFTKLFGVVR